MGAVTVKVDASGRLVIPREMREALDLGVSGIITGNPRDLSELRGDDPV